MPQLSIIGTWIPAVLCTWGFSEHIWFSYMTGACPIVLSIAKCSPLTSGLAMMRINMGQTGQKLSYIIGAVMG